MEDNSPSVWEVSWSVHIAITACTRLLTEHADLSLLTVLGSELGTALPRGPLQGPEAAQELLLAQTAAAELGP